MELNGDFQDTACLGDLFPKEKIWVVWCVNVLMSSANKTKRSLDRKARGKQAGAGERCVLNVTIARYCKTT